MECHRYGWKMSGYEREPGVVSGALKRGITWWWDRSGIRVHHLLAFIGIQTISWSMVGLIREAITANTALFARLETGPFDYFSLGGSLVIYSLIAVLSVLALLDGRLQIPIAIGLLIFETLSVALLGSFESVKSYSSVSRNELELGIAVWSPRLLILAVLVSLVIFLIGVVKRFSRKVDDWMARRSPSLLSDGQAVGADSQTTSILAVVALLFSPFVPLLGIILGYVALNDIAVSGGTKRGKDMSVAAIVIAVASIVLISVLLFFLWFVGTFLLIGPLAPEF